MPKTLLEIVRDVTDEIGHIARPSVVMTTSDPLVRQIRRVSEREGRALVREFRWTVLQKLHSISTVASQEEYDLPEDYDRHIDDTEWDRTNTRPLIGPLSVAEWESIKSSTLGSGIVGSRYRMMRGSTENKNKFYIDPVPSAVETLVLWYISKNWCQSSGGDEQSAWAADTDTLIVDEELFTLGTIVRLKRARGLEYASEAFEYEEMLQQRKSHDRPSRRISLVGSQGSQYITPANLPSTGIGQ